MFTARPARRNVWFHALGWLVFGAGLAGAGVVSSKPAGVLFFGLPALLCFARSLRMFARLKDAPSLRIDGRILSLRIPAGGILEGLSPVTTWRERQITLGPTTRCLLSTEPNLFGAIESLRVEGAEPLTIQGHWFDGGLGPVQAAILDAIAGEPGESDRAIAALRARLARARWPARVELPRRANRYAPITIAVATIVLAITWLTAASIGEVAVYIPAGMLSLVCVIAIAAASATVWSPPARLFVGPDGLCVGAQEVAWEQLSGVRPHTVRTEHGPERMVGLELLVAGRPILADVYNVPLETLASLLSPPPILAGYAVEHLERGIPVEHAVEFARLPPTPG